MSAKYKHPGNTKAGRYERKMRAMKKNKTAGCYVATCVYGSYDCPQVWTLRKYRDHRLTKTIFGRVFIRSYYTVSPAIVKLLGKNKLIQKFWRMQLDNIVHRLNVQGYSSDPYQDLI